MAKYAVVTGADRGLGFALTLELIQDGYTVFAGRFMPEWEALTQLPEEVQARIIALPLDVANESSVQAAAKEIASVTGQIDLLVNNAGICGDQEGNILGDIDYGLLHEMYEVNAVGPLRMAHALQSLLLAGEEKLVVNISSEAGQINQAWREGWYG
ncbi:NAD(P)-dependent dehydrogenase (short-subunit alcohol dehydrogenase family) [Paenibacillus phyllosphaerae]|uniref:NAD(P)-dependent dehydrogenase (Short-subunit alcohol dehydrogenase family) n=1 Tax=Paenibacillus phyllosphaerae TaxID=274593 RepID=A0A7W5B1K7_9BACL|nr:SDR family NAD(P)-dependent oxidoreductase [Paenibacillus phyllosphaerae]MBB3112774.1 NAD(P)-dependent dehydrogenase (short-subunit alcohol dehydrogenase family) [Paenibacillus phyllosphaerae]